MKKLALLLAVLMLMSAMLVACSKKNNDADDDDETKDPAIVDDETEGTTDEEGSEEGTENGSEEETTDDYVEPTNLTFKEVESVTIYTTAIVNIRKEASFANSVEKKSVVEGTALTKIAECEETLKDSDGFDYKWYKVTYEDAEWYVKSTLTTTLADPDEGFTPVEKTLYLNTQGLSVRQFPNTENNPVAYLAMGDEIKVIAENTETGWYKIDFEGKYVKGEFYITSDAKYFSETPVETPEA